MKRRIKIHTTINGNKHKFNFDLFAIAIDHQLLLLLISFKANNNNTSNSTKEKKNLVITNRKPAESLLSKVLH